MIAFYNLWEGYKINKFPYDLPVCWVMISMAERCPQNFILVL